MDKNLISLPHQEPASAAAPLPAVARLDEHLHALQGRFPVEGRPAAISAIRMPLFVVGTEPHHIAPWRSVHKIHLLYDGDKTFVMTSGGHNAGVVSPPGHPHRHYRLACRPTGTRYVGPDDWMAQNIPHDGSWWPAWAAWLAAHGLPPLPRRRGRAQALRP